MNQDLEARVAAAVREPVDMAEYDPAWPRLFEEEKARLAERFPPPLIGRIAHFGSTAVPGLAAKPVIDMLAETACSAQARRVIAPALEKAGYDYFWRPAFDGSNEHYAWFIRRGADGRRTHHIHVVEASSSLWERLYFRDYLRVFPETAREYEHLKRRLAAKYRADRVAYTEGKTAFIVETTQRAKAYFGPG